MIRNSRKSTFKVYKSIKNFFDLLFSLLFLITSLPLFLIISLLIKLSSRGPTFFLQKRGVSLDINYVENYSLLMDLRILFRTFGVILFPLDRGAY